MSSQTAIVFPGQGSQSVGMLTDIAAIHPEVKATFDEASSALSYDLWQLVQSGPAEKLDMTMYTQPALLAASYAIWRILRKNQVTNPVMMAGHSLGEYTALVCANAIDYADALRLVAARGQFMQEAVLPGVGAMAAIIGLENQAVANLCKEVALNNEVLTPANFNSIGQVVIAGHKEAVLRALPLAKERGAKMAVLIPVSVPSHCALMREAAERLAEILVTTKMRTPEITVLSNVDVTAYNTTESIRDGLVRQLSMPVRWVDTIQAFSNAGVTQIIECGPGKVLSGLIKRIDKNIQIIAASDVANLALLS